MIETFVRQEITDPEDWFRKVPQFQRSGTNPIEKNAYLQNICDIVSRVDRGLVRSEARQSHSSEPLNPDLFSQAVNTSNAVATEASIAPQGQLGSAPIYKATDFTTLSIRLDPESFYEPTYRAKIRQMVSLVIETEGPIYDDLLVQRVARAHGFQRSGPTIHALVLGAVEKRFQKTREDGREVFWRLDSDPTVPCPFRSGDVGVRSHADVPVSELASIALPFVRLRMLDESILRKMVERLDLGRLREVTRKRLLEAITFARESLARNTP